MSRRLRAEVGQTAAEYLGGLLIVSVIIAAVAMTDAGTHIKNEMARIVCEIGGGGDCGEPGESEATPPEPSECVVSQATDKVTIKGHVDLRWFTVKLEGGVEYTRQKRANGEVAMTFKLSNSGGLSERLKKLVDVTVKGGPASSVTFLLPNDEAANRFAADVKDAAKAMAYAPLQRFGIGDEYDMNIDFPPIETVQFEYGGGVSGSVEADGAGGYGEGGLEGAYALGYKQNFTEGRESSGDRTVFYKVSGKATGAGGLPMVGPGFTGNLAGESDARRHVGQGRQREEVESAGRRLLRRRRAVPGQPEQRRRRAEVHRRAAAHGQRPVGQETRVPGRPQPDRCERAEHRGSVPHRRDPGRPGRRGQPAVEPLRAEGPDPDAHVRHGRVVRERRGRAPARPRRGRRHLLREHERRADGRLRVRAGSGLRPVGAVRPPDEGRDRACARGRGAGGLRWRDDEAAAVPDGFEQFDGPTFTFAYPSGWSPLEAGTVQGAQGPKGTGGLAPQAAVSSGKSPNASLDLVMNAFRTDQQTRRGNWKVVKEEKVEVEGAKEAVMTEAVYDEVTGGTTTPVRTIDVHALTEDGTLYDFFVRAPEADFDQQRLREAVETFRIT